MRAGRPRFKRFQLAPTGPSLQSAARLRDGSAALPSHAPKPVVLMILDGWGHRDDPADNALAQPTLPHWRALLATCPHTLVHTEVRHGGLPDGQMGHSKVARMNLGAGRIVHQDRPRVYDTIEGASFFANPELRAHCEAVLADEGTLRLMGLVSAGGVQRKQQHLYAMLQLAARINVLP